MKKCPYCKTFMNDDVNSCPNCLKDMSSLKPMPEVTPKDNKKTFNMIIYGGILTLGGIIASLSQGINKKGYQVKYDELAETIKSMSDGADKQALVNKASEYLTLINECKFREIAFLVIAGAGLLLIIVTLVLYFINKAKNKKEK